MVFQSLRRHTVSTPADLVAPKKTPPTEVGGVQGRTTCLTASSVATPGVGGRGSHPICRRAGSGATACAGAPVATGGSRRRRCIVPWSGAACRTRERPAGSPRTPRHGTGSVRCRAHASGHRPVHARVESRGAGSPSRRQLTPFAGSAPGAECPISGRLDTGIRWPAGAPWRQTNHSLQHPFHGLRPSSRRSCSCLGAPPAPASARAGVGLGTGRRVGRLGGGGGVHGVGAAGRAGRRRAGGHRCRAVHRHR